MVETRTAKVYVTRGLPTAALDLLAGGNIYENCVETKPPATYMLFAFVFNAFGRSMVYIYILSMVFHGAVIICLYIFGRLMINRFQGAIWTIK